MSDRAGTLMRPRHRATAGQLERRPRARARRPVALALAVVAVATGSLVFRQRALLYDPIELGPLEFDGTASPGNARLDLGGYRAAYFPAVAGKEFHVRWNITNRGDRAVRVTDVPFEVTSPYVERVRLEIGDGSAGERLRSEPPAAYVQFHPFVLRPHQSRELSFTYRFRDCPFPPFDGVYERHDASGGTTISAGFTSTWTGGQKVVYQVWGIERRTVLQPRTPIVLVNATGACDRAPGG